MPGSEMPPGHDVVLLIDVSRSMAAEDAVPDRLGAATTAAEGLIRSLANVEGKRAPWCVRRPRGGQMPADREP